MGETGALEAIRKALTCPPTRFRGVADPSLRQAGAERVVTGNAAVVDPEFLGFELAGEAVA
jgi:hypothetical protein